VTDIAIQTVVVRSLERPDRGSESTSFHRRLGEAASRVKPITRARADAAKSCGDQEFCGGVDREPIDD
jgi:hypothetical protein